MKMVVACHRHSFQEVVWKVVVQCCDLQWRSQSTTVSRGEVLRWRQIYAKGVAKQTLGWGGVSSKWSGRPIESKPVITVV